MLNIVKLQNQSLNNPPNLTALWLEMIWDIQSEQLIFYFCGLRLHAHPPDTK